MFFSVRLKELITVTAFLAVFPLNAMATIYYVDNTNGSASDSNAGTNSSLPWLTIGKCVSKPLAAGDTCEVLHGVYDTRMTVSISGSSGNPITFDGNSQGARVRDFTVKGSNITIQNFEISNCKDASHTPGTACTTAMSSDNNESILFSTNGLTNIIIQNNSIHDTTQGCIRLWNSASSIQILNNALNYCGETQDIVPNVGTQFSNNNFTINTSNNQIAFQVQGGATQTVTLNSGSYSSNSGWNGAFPSLSSFGAQVVCGNSGNCSLTSLTKGPTSSITLVSVGSSAYSVLGWTAGAGAFEGHSSAILGGNGTGASNILVSGNSASHFNEFTQWGNGDTRIVIRNNFEGPTGSFSYDHHDGFLSGGNNTQVLLEGNYAHDNHSSDSRMPLGLVEENTDGLFINRYNYDFNNVGADGFLPQSGEGTQGLYFYNNNIGVNASANHYNNAGSQQIHTGQCNVSPDNCFTTNKAANNIWYYACCGGSNHDPYSYSSNLTVSNDLYIGSSAPCSAGYGCTASGLVNSDPLFASVSTGNYSLTSTSPARNAGSKLATTTNSGSGSTSITLSDPYWFQDGWAGVNPDCIAIGTITNFGCFVAGTINYSTGAATLDRSLTWSSGASVWLYSKSDAVQVLTDTTGPDIGAFPYNASQSSLTAQTITFGALSGQIFGAAPFIVGATASSGLAVTFSSQTPSVCTVSGNTVTLVATGTCTIAADQGGNGTYAAAPEVTQSFSVSAATLTSQTITFGTLSGQTFGAAPFNVSATASSGLAVIFSSQTPSVCTVSGNTVTLVATGTCTIAADQGGNGAYAAAPEVAQSFTVSARTLRRSQTTSS